MVRFLDEVPYKQGQWGHAAARNVIKAKQNSSMLRLDQAGNLTYFYLKVKHLSILPETWQVVWYRYY